MAVSNGEVLCLWFCLLSAGFLAGVLGAPEDHTVAEPQQQTLSSGPSSGLSVPGGFAPQAQPAVIAQPAVVATIPSGDPQVIAEGGQPRPDSVKKLPSLHAEKKSGSDKDLDEACRGLQVTTTKMSTAPLAILYYFNPDSVIHFHSLSLLLPDGKTFLSDVRAVVRDPPPSNENPYPKAVAHLSGGYKLTLSLEGVKLEDHEGSEIAAWEAESVLHPVILEEVSIRDAAAIAPASTGLAGAAVSSVATSPVPGGIPDAPLVQGAVGGAVDNSQGGPEAVVAGGRAVKSVRVLAVSRGNLGTVRISTNRNISAGMGAFTCVFRTGIYGDYDPCNTPAVIAANFFTPLTASIIGGF